MTTDPQHLTGKKNQKPIQPPPFAALGFVALRRRRPQQLHAVDAEDDRLSGGHGGCPDARWMEQVPW